MELVATSTRESIVGKDREWNVRAVYTLGFLTLISSFNYLDRSLLGLVLPLVKRDMHLSDTMLGLLSGLAFVLFYSTLGMPIAWLADRFNRRNIIAAGLAVWSVMTALTGLVVSTWQLAIARFLMGAGEACGIAPSNAMVADVFSKRHRSLAVSILAMASSISWLCFYPLAGWIAEQYGWRATFMAAGIPGVVLALLFIVTVKEPVRGAKEAASDSKTFCSFVETLRFLAAAKSYRYMLIGMTCMGATVYSAGAWNSTFLVRVHHLNLAEIGAIVGPIRGVLTALGVVAGGMMASRASRRGDHLAIWVAAVSCLLVAPAEVLFLLGGTQSTWVIGLAASSLFGIMHQGPIFAACMNVAQPRMRATAIAIAVFCAGLVAQSIGPLLIGYLNDRLAATFGDGAIRYSMLTIAGCAIGAFAAFMTAARYIRADMQRADLAVALQPTR